MLQERVMKYNCFLRGLEKSQFFFYRYDFIWNLLRSDGGEMANGHENTHEAKWSDFLQEGGNGQSMTFNLTLCKRMDDENDIKVSGSDT